MDWEDALAWVLNGLGLGLALATFFLRWPAAIIACTLVPWAALLTTVLLRKSPMGFWGRRREGPNLIMTFLLPGAGLCMWARTDVNFLDLRPVLVASAIVAIVLVGMLYVVQARRMPKDIRVLLSLLMFGGLYGFGVVTAVDVVGDSQAVASYPTVVAGLRHFNKGSAWTLAPWGPMRDETTAGLGRLTNKVKAGDRVCVTLHDGRLRLEWYEVNGCP